MPWRERLVQIVPPPLQGEVGSKFLAEVGQQWDTIAARAADAVAIGRFTDQPADALELSGQDRQLPRYAGESDADYAERLRLAWDAWALAGSPVSVLRELKRAGFLTGTTGAIIVTYAGKAYWLDGDDLQSGTLAACRNRLDKSGALSSPNGWTFEPVNDTCWSIFGVIYPQSYTITPERRGEFNSIIKLWSPVWALYAGCWILQTGRMFGIPVTQTFGGPSVTFGASVVDFVPPYDGNDTRLGYTPEFP
jgi:hypothetical protein